MLKRTAKTIIKYVSKEIGEKKYKKLVAKRTDYKEILKIVEFVSVQKTGKLGEFLMGEKEYYDLETVVDYKFPCKCGKCSLEWNIRLKDIKTGSWCPECANGFMERACRLLVEKILSYYYKEKIKFPSIKLSKIIINKRIESEILDEKIHIENLLKHGHIDCYNPDLNLGFGVNGQQHYFFVPYFHKVIEKFEYDKTSDKVKKALININNIKFFIIPFWEFNSGLQDYAILELEKLLEIDLKSVPRFNVLSNYIKNQKLIEEYINYNESKEIEESENIEETENNINSYLCNNKDNNDFSCKRS